MPTSPKNRPRLVLVGEANPYGGDPEFALYPAPEGCSGHRLCCLILGMRRRDYLGAFERVNLCPQTWSLREARVRAVDLLLAGGRFVLLGSKVCSGFGIPYLPFVVQDEILMRLPHPSGLCRAWNESGVIRRARGAVAAFAPDIAHLLGAADQGDRE